MTHVASHNWFHFLVEVVSLLAAPEVRETNLRLLVNRSVMSGNFGQALQVLGAECFDRFMPSADWGKVECKTLVQPDGVWTPSHYHNDPLRSDHLDCGFTDPKAAKDLYQKAWPKRSPLKTKIVIERLETSIERCTNQDAFIEHFRKAGFQVVSPESLSFSEQVELFYDADVIVGISGAAFANLVFCRPGTRIVCARSEESGSATYSKLSDGLDLDFSYYDAKGTGNSPIRDYARFGVDAEEMHATALRGG